MPETRIDKSRAFDAVRCIDDFRALKNRLLNQELARLEDERQAAVQASDRETALRAQGEEAGRLRQEARREAEARIEQSREALSAKFEKIESDLRTLAGFLTAAGSVRDLEVRLAERDRQLRRDEEELVVRQKVFARETQDLERDRAELKAREEALARRTAELEARAAALDLQRRAAELRTRREELDVQLRAYEGEMADLHRKREGLNGEFDGLGRRRADLERAHEALDEEQRALDEEKLRMSDAVAREMAATFEAFVRDLLRPEGGSNV